MSSPTRVRCPRSSGGTPSRSPDDDSTVHVPRHGRARLAIVTNGLSLCKNHHAAYDRNLLGISSAYRVEINRSLLEEVDGPMLKHGLQEMHGTTMPSRRNERPDRERLSTRFDPFRAS